jgi:alpha-galactosidase
LLLPNALRPRLPFAGLDERAVYRVESIGGKLVDAPPQLSGAYLMKAGLNLNLRGDFDATAVILERVD